MESYRIQDLTFAYPERRAEAIRDVSLTIEQGQFVVLCGPSGCGKTTLLRQLKPVLAPHGERSGEIFFEGAPISELDHRAQSERIGFVLQSPDNQIVTDKVWHELAFGLESLGYKTNEIRLKVSEMASFFGIQTWFHKSVTELSGGQKQLLNLASIMAMQPSVLILDEPTSQLDPIAAADFLATVGKINRELGVTVVMTEHRLEEVFPIADRVICMDDGCVIADGSPENVGRQLRGAGHGMFLAMPAPMRIYAGVPNELECPITVRDGRAWIDEIVKNTAVQEISSPKRVASEKQGEAAVELDEVWFRYEKDSPDIVKGVNLRVERGDFLCILGGNGTGKTTTLNLIGGINAAHRGKIRMFGEELEKIPHERMFGTGTEGGLLGVLPQNPQSLFVKKTVREDLMEIFSGRKIPKEERETRVKAVSRLCKIEPLMNSHPYDLSGGEQQRAALAKVLLLKPRVLLLDEPTKGLDAEFKVTFASIVRSLSRSGVTIIMVSHDIEFCAEHAGTCAMFFDGGIVSAAAPREFFAGNSFYTTSANRMARHIMPGAVTVEDVILSLGGEVEVPEELGKIDDFDGDLFDGPEIEYQAAMPDANITLSQRVAELPRWRKVTAFIAGVLMLATLAFLLINRTEFVSAISGGSEAAQLAPGQIWTNVAIIVALAIEAIVISATIYGSGKAEAARSLAKPQKLQKRTLVAIAMVLVAIPVTIIAGILYLNDRRYYIVSLLIIIETILPFVLIFEGRKPQARELVILAVLCAIATMGRAAFFMLPQFKPVIALVIVGGIAFGGETGFLIGAVTMFVSNIMMQQGPWTPWQMFSAGIIGLLAGVLFRKGLLSRSRTALSVFGGIATFVIYGLIMDTSTVFTNQPDPQWPMFLAAYLQGIPMNLVHAASTVVFLQLVAQPMLEKLDRIKVKYGLY